MSAKLSVQDSARLFKLLDTQHEDWIISHALKIVERRVFHRGEEMRNPQVVKDFLRTKLAQQRNEIFAVLFLDSRNRVIAYEELFHGTIDHTTVYPRVVLSKALEHNAAAVIISHNHPSGTTDPSQADRALTSVLKSALMPIDIKVLDHLIVGEGQPFSFAEHGLI
ncbi:RadC family protein [Pseudomonas aeruginosa]|uniref:RadC family protein n=1 Tax=Pseudomonas aeruginosa TaxID=287 RepID=UPI000B512F9D|nr:DNA repair protein RadC [Pseudomonas aeruginosa]ASD11683.1 DNA repair protein RadC [Pseudomonas aeruginosa]